MTRTLASSAIYALAVLVLLTAVTAPVRAQLGTATISGTIKDSTGAVLQAASVTATNSAT